MTAVLLEALSGFNPLCLFAALGALDGLDRRKPGAGVALSWTDELVPKAVLHRAGDLDAIVEALDADRRDWTGSILLNWEPSSAAQLEDLKPTPAELRSWIEAMLASDREARSAELALLAALVAEGAVDGAGKTKPTHFHFTAGQQRFLVMVRQLVSGVDAGRLHEALAGPWRYDSPLPVLGWDSRGERIYAVRATNPSKDKKLGVPGADWLGFLGLAFFPVWNRGGTLWTTGCSGTWKQGSFTWPLWSGPLTPPVVRSLLRDCSLARQDDELRALRGVSHVVRAPIRRSEQGGYGSFGAVEPVARTRRAGPQRSLLLRSS